MDLNRMLFLKYPTDDKQKMALIIDNREFKESYANRQGNGAEEMERLFIRDLGFGIVNNVNDLSCKDMKTKLGQAVNDAEKAKVGCFVCVILSYGVEGCIYGASGEENDKMEVRDVMEMFNGTNCKSLIGTPKLYFIQTCPPRSKTQRDGPKNKEVIRDEKVEYHMTPVEADQLLVQSCIPGYQQWKEKDQDKSPSWFIQSLKEAIGDGQLDLMSSLTKMQGKLYEKIRGASGDGTEMKLPYISSTLRKDVCFL